MALCIGNLWHLRHYLRSAEHPKRKISKTITELNVSIIRRTYVPVKRGSVWALQYLEGIGLLQMSFAKKAIMLSVDTYQIVLPQI